MPMNKTNGFINNLNPCNEKNTYGRTLRILLQSTGDSTGIPATCCNIENQEKNFSCT